MSYENSVEALSWLDSFRDGEAIDSGRGEAKKAGDSSDEGETHFVGCAVVAGTEYRGFELTSAPIYTCRLKRRVRAGVHRMIPSSYLYMQSETERIDMRYVVDQHHPILWKRRIVPLRQEHDRDDDNAKFGQKYSLTSSLLSVAMHPRNRGIGSGGLFILVRQCRMMRSAVASVAAISFAISYHRC